MRAQAAGYRYRRGVFQINLALSARPRFQDSRLDAGGPHHLGRGLDALVTSVRQAEAGLLPEHPDDRLARTDRRRPHPRPRRQGRRAPTDTRRPPSGDAAGTPYGAGGWDPATADAFADRVLAEAEPHAPGLTGLVLERHLTTPADLAKQSPTAGPGDHAAGDNSLAGALTQRPIPARAGGAQPRRAPG